MLTGTRPHFHSAERVEQERSVPQGWLGIAAGSTGTALRTSCQPKVEAREARAAAAGGGGATTGEGASAGKSKAAKRKQQKRKAQQKKRAAEAAAAAAAVAGAAAAAAAVEPSRGHRAGVEEAKEGEEVKQQQQQQQEQQQQQQQQQIGDFAAATLGLTLQGEDIAEEEEVEEEEEECSVCLCVFLESDGRGCRLVCKHVYHTACLALWQANCVRKAIAPTCPYCRAP